MRLQRFYIEKLFGLFDHEIQFNLDERVTIVHAPNGFGKTVILKMIAAMFGGQLPIFRLYDYSKLTFFFDDKSFLEITQLDRLEETPANQTRSYRMDYHSDNGTETWNPDERRPAGTTIVSPTAFERYFPHLLRISDRQWRDRVRMDVLSYDEVIDRYWQQLPPNARRHGPHPKWLSDLRAAIHCRLIETNRLMVFEKRDERVHRPDEGPTPVVKAYTNELFVSIGRLLAESATLSQALDQTFPNRILARMQQKEDAPSEETLRIALAKLEGSRTRLANAGLLQQSDDGTISPAVQLDVNTRKILAEYVSDTSNKLAFYDPMLRKLELFTEILNARYQFKTVRTSRDSGLDIKDHRGNSLSPEALSSGEQHELILIYDLLFKTNKNTLILIDEPEISLHVAWQKRFIPDLQRIIELTEVDAVIATHSAQIIGSYLDLTVQLQGPGNDEEVFDN